MVKFCCEIIVISLLSLAANGESKEKIITVCSKTKGAYLHINTAFSEEKKDQTSFKIYEETSDEKYVLSQLITVDNENDKFIFLPNRFYNISYSSAKNSFINWNMLDLIREQKIKAEVLNENHPLIIRSYEPHVDEQVYFFNLDHKGNGTMSVVNTRWSSFMSVANNQSLFYAVCKKP